MTRPLEVWGTSHVPVIGERGLVTRQQRTIVAAPSRAAAARALGASSYAMSQWGSRTENPYEVAAALAEPGQVFWRPLDQWDGGWRRASIPEGRYSLYDEDSLPIT